MVPKDFVNQQLQNSINSHSPATLMGLRGVLRFNRVPTWLVYVVITAVVASWIPLAAAVRSKFVRSDQPRVHLFQDMDNQAKYKAQSVNPVFENNMAMRPIIAGTVARGELEADDMLHRGFRVTGVGEDGTPQVEWADAFPSQIEVDAELLTKGKELWARYCYLCHGYDGYGNGPIHVRAKQKVAQNPNWIAPSSMHDEARRERPVGHIYNTVNMGIRSMAGYGAQIQSAEDRWAIVAYVRALQLSQHADPSLVPDDIADAAPVRLTRVDGKDMQLGGDVDVVTPPGTTAPNLVPGQEESDNAGLGIDTEVGQAPDPRGPSND